MKFKPGDKIIANWPDVIEGVGTVVGVHAGGLKIKLIKTPSSKCAWDTPTQWINPRYLRYDRAGNLDLI
jgi:hypothetical protein